MVHHSAALVEETGDASLPETVVSGLLDQVPARLQALLIYAIRLTVSPQTIQRADVEQLQRAGLTPREVIDANQVVAYFNYVNRVSEGLGVELESHWPESLKTPRLYTLRARFSN